MTKGANSCSEGTTKCNLNQEVAKARQFVKKRGRLAKEVATRGMRSADQTRDGKSYFKKGLPEKRIDRRRCKIIVLRMGGGTIRKKILRGGG